jgi:putative RecB family exonuclease
MTTFSHSKIGTFETCALQYKFHYIDKIKVLSEDTVETFLGSYVHLALEKLYKDLSFENLLSLKELIDYFNKSWLENWNDTIKVNKYTPENYRKMGVRFLTDYYNRYKPFDQGKIIGLETTDFLDLGSGYKFHVRIDRLMDMGNGVYEVHDYKTNNSLPKQEKLDSDRQLAMYSLWVKEHFKDFKKVKLVWHFLAFDKELNSSRTASQLEDLRKEVLNLIKKIENAKEFPSNVTRLCDWCLFQGICPEFKHSKDLEEKPVNEFLKDPGVKLVNSYVKVKKELDEYTKQAEETLGLLKEALIKFCSSHGVTAVVGSDNKISVKEYNSVSLSAKKDREDLNKLLIDAGLWDEFSDLDRYKLIKAFNEDSLPKEVMKNLDKFIKVSKNYRLSVGKK